ncbi:organic solute transporter Ostalpha-domain-containing protein [Cristinia sonorae]|uniref:Organic solute transporter Ostalpha-domain-containing protein n=1 Tax=Cristinia sonorae TaxID=1940300 RepID=A0A8K0XJT3_9AGAR|nr:organic solute transporter Ostalpha-domain-containing protein [Cristinia sonorae]
MVVRIMIMVPLYAISSLISLFSLQAAFFIDVIRDIYEAFVIYCFFELLVAYLGGERSLLILLHGRPPKYPVFPTSLFWREVDVSDPYTFLFLKRGILQYVQVKPVLALATIILKIVGKYNEGNLQPNSGYLYVSIVYNFSICMSLYCLAMFWMCVNDDLKPFRPMPKFLCVKGILFFSFWQSIFISILVAAGAITKLGPYTDAEHISLGLTDCLICLEMPIFAIAHQYAFSSSDFVDPHAIYVARMPILYAFRDAFGLKDVVEDSKATLRGEGMEYRDFEPSEGHMHQGVGRERRIRAGLRYSQGGKRKYWLPQPTHETRPPGTAERRFNRAIEGITRRPDQGEEVYAPLLAGQAEDVVHLAPDLREDEDPNLFSEADLLDEGYDLPFGDIDPSDEELFEHSRKYLFGDYNYPCVDVSNEFARVQIWDEEERILRDERGAYFSPILGPNNPNRPFGKSREGGYGATGHSHRDITPGEGRGLVIDKEQDRTPAPSMSAADVRLGWTNSQGLSPAQIPRVRTLSYQRAATPGSPSSSSSSPRDKPPPPRQETERPVLPPDAVDLIVEDQNAAEEEHTHERRKGEPAVRGLHKVYRRGYVRERNGHREEGEVEVEEPYTPSSNPNSPHGGEQQPKFAAGDEVNAALEAEEEAIETVARVETPPLHARIHVDLASEDNPWA